MSEQGWFVGIDPTDVEAAAARIRQGSADAPRPWADVAVEHGSIDDVDAYYDALRAASLTALDAELEAVAGAADVELIQLVRTLDAMETMTNELRQRLTEAYGAIAPTNQVEGLAEMRSIEADGTLADRLEGLAGLAIEFDRERADLEGEVRKTAASIAPNLTDLAEPLLAARLVAAAGSLEELARMPSSTVQVLGAEDALFAHLRGDAPSPKHGLIYLHPTVQNAQYDHRGRVARTLAGKLTIAARIDHYRGERDEDFLEEAEASLARGRGEAGQ